MTTQRDHPTLGAFEAQYVDDFDAARRTLTIYAGGIRTTTATAG